MTEETDKQFVERMIAETPVLHSLNTERLLALALRGAERQETRPDWFWRDLDPDDSGSTVDEALRNVPGCVVCAIRSSYLGPSFFAAIVPVLDAESDDTEVIRADNEDDCLAAVKQRIKALTALGEPKDG